MHLLAIRSIVLPQLRLRPTGCEIWLRPGIIVGECGLARRAVTNSGIDWADGVEAETCRAKKSLQTVRS